jgi:hypothetical protein
MISPYQTILDESSTQTSKEDILIASINLPRQQQQQQQQQGTSTTKKDILITNDSTKIDIDNHIILRHPNFTWNFPLCLVHVGKAAGSSISCGLGLMYADCEGMPRDPPLPNTYYIHMKRDTCRPIENNGRNNKIETFLMPIRNPLFRIRSWFNFEKNIVPTRPDKNLEQRMRWKRGLLFKECYNNFVDLVVDGLSVRHFLVHDNTTTTSEVNLETATTIANMTCPQRAWAAILGAREFSYHEWYNYEYYWTVLQTHHSRLFANNSSSSSSPALIVLRTEHLLEDWKKVSKEELYRQVNQAGTRGNVVLPQNDTTKQSYSHQERDARMLEGSSFWKNLCCAVCPELQVYKQILHKAQNLNNSEVRESIDEIQAYCPEETNQIRSCPGIPNFPLMKIPRRRYKAEIKKRLFTVG